MELLTKKIEAAKICQQKSFQAVMDAFGKVDSATLGRLIAQNRADDDALFALKAERSLLLHKKQEAEMAKFYSAAAKTRRLGQALGL